MRTVLSVLPVLVFCTDWCRREVLGCKGFRGELLPLQPMLGRPSCSVGKPGSRTTSSPLLGSDEREDAMCLQDGMRMYGEQGRI